MKHTIHPDLIAAQKLVYECNGFTPKSLTIDAESQEYSACTFEMNNKIIKFRVAKITPTKIGQFATLWKRIKSGPIMPYDITDPVDLFIVSVHSAEHLGQFVFPKDILWEKGFISKDGKGGKRAMRVYPPWNMPDSSLAKKTQAWQLLYFIGIKPHLDNTRVRKLFF